MPENSAVITSVHTVEKKVIKIDLRRNAYGKFILIQEFPGPDSKGYRESKPNRVAIPFSGAKKIISSLQGIIERELRHESEIKRQSKN